MVRWKRPQQQNSQNEKTLRAIRCHFSSTCVWCYLTVKAGNGTCCAKSCRFCFSVQLYGFKEWNNQIKTSGKRHLNLCEQQKNNKKKKLLSNCFIGPSTCLTENENNVVSESGSEVFSLTWGEATEPFVTSRRGAFPEWMFVQMNGQNWSWKKLNRVHRQDVHRSLVGNTNKCNFPWRRKLDLLRTQVEEKGSRGK